jgi:tripartite-type tricarboxylate transporter receptor subunit TctC
MSNDRRARAGTLTRRSVLGSGLGAGAGLLTAWLPVLADERFPWKPMRLIVPYPPGGSNDNVARLVAAALSKTFGQTVLIDNRPGAGGVIGLDALSKSPPDGHTLVLVSSSFATSAAVQPKLPFDPQADFEPVARAASSAFVVLVSPHLGFQDLKGLIEVAKARPGKVTYGSSGIGSANQFVTELFASAAGIQMVHVPYRGMTPALTDLAGGHLDVVFTTASSAHAFLSGRKVIALAVTSSERMASLPTVPTCLESGLPNFGVDGWAGFMVPRGTPPATIAALNKAINGAMSSPEMAKTLADEGSAPFKLSSMRTFGAGDW